MNGVVGSFLVIAGAIVVVCLITIVVTSNLLPIFIGGAVIWALFCIANGIAGDKR